MKYTHTKTSAYVPSGRANGTVQTVKGPYERFASKLATRFRDSAKAKTRKRVFSNDYPAFGGSLGTTYVDTDANGANDSIQRTYRAESVT
jgi:hypothetical protein